MSSAEPVIAVLGATGQQGGAAVAHLLEHGWRVRAVVRDPHSAASRRLASAGAEPAVGDLDDRVGLEAVMRGTHGVFSVQPASIPPDFAPNELRRGINVADAARAAEVPHLVYSSVAGADRGTGVAHWEIKWRVEQHIQRNRVLTIQPKQFEQRQRPKLSV